MAYYPPKPDQQPTRHPRSSRYNSQPQPYQQPYGNQYPQAQQQYPQQQYGGQYPQYQQQYPQAQGQWQQYPQAYQQPYAGQQAVQAQQKPVTPAKRIARKGPAINAKLVALGGGCIAVIALVIVILSVAFGGGPKYTTLRAPEMTTLAKLFPVISSLYGAEGMDAPVYFAAVQVDKDMSDADLIKIYQKRLGSQEGRNQVLYVYKDKSYYDKNYFMPDYAIVSNSEGPVACQRITPDMLASLAMMEALGGGSMEGFVDFANSMNDLSESINGIE